MISASDSNTIPQNTKRILLGHLASFGDCLYATTVARQIKIDYPNCHLTWAIGSKYHSIIDGNPYVDEKWIIPLENLDNIKHIWENFEKEAQNRKLKGDFDEIFLTQFSPCHEYRYDGSIRSTTFRGYPKPITISINPIIRLSDNEIDNVKKFAELHKLQKKEQVILFECHPQSLQSFVNTDFAIKMSEQIIKKFPNTCIILSSNKSLEFDNKNIIDASVLSFRENAELTKYCSLLIGCSSGITWLCTSDWAKPLPMIQLINSNSRWFASVIHDHQLWNLSIQNIIEISECQSDLIQECVYKFFLEGIDEAKLKFHQNIPVSFHGYESILKDQLKRWEIYKSILLLINHIKRNGLYEMLVWHIFKMPINILKKIKNKLKSSRI